MFRIAQICRLRVNTDGEGVRTLIAAAGCPLRCRYCINPHTWNGKGRVRLLSAKELYDEIRLDQLYFISTGGGVTFGGGEPLLYASDIAGFRELCGDEYTLYAETSLAVPWEAVSTAASCIDRFYVDIKAMEPDQYRLYTGGDLTLAIDNLRRLLEISDPDHIVVRIPRIPGLTSAADQQRSKEKLEGMGVQHFQLFSYTIPSGCTDTN